MKKLLHFYFYWSCLWRVRSCNMYSCIVFKQKTSYLHDPVANVSIGCALSQTIKSRSLGLITYRRSISQIAIHNSQFKFDGNYTRLQFNRWPSDRNIVLHMSRPHSCLAMCHRLPRKLCQNRGKGRTKFISNWKCDKKTVIETGPWFLSINTGVLTLGRS